MSLACLAVHAKTRRQAAPARQPPAPHQTPIPWRFNFGDARCCAVALRIHPARLLHLRFTPPAGAASGSAAAWNAPSGAPAAARAIGAGPSAAPCALTNVAPVLLLIDSPFLSAQLAVPLALGYGRQVCAVGVARPVAACMGGQMTRALYG